MSSEAITRNDLEAVLNSVLPPQTTIYPWVSLYRSNFTGNNTSTKITGITIQNGTNASDYFTVGTDQVTIKKSGNYKISITYRLSATSNAANVKRVSLYQNSTETLIAMGRWNTYEDCTHITIRTFSVGDVITLYRRFEDGNSTCEQMRCIIEYID